MFISSDNGKVISRAWVNENYHGEKVFTIPEGYDAIDFRAFYNINTLEKVIIPSGIIEIGANAFEECYGLKEVVLPDTVLTIGEASFAWCKNLEAINFPNNLYAIGENAFRGCAFKEISLSDNIKAFGRGIFEDCSSLEKVKLPNNLSVIPTHAFYNCEKLTNIQIPDKVERIEDAAFCGTGIKNIDINNVSILKSSAFSFCPNLEKVRYKSIKTIKFGCFGHTDNLKEVSQIDFCDTESHSGYRIIATDLAPELLQSNPFDISGSSIGRFHTGLRFKADDVLTYDIYLLKDWGQTAKEKELAEFISNPSYENFKNMSCADYKIPIAIAYGMSQNDEYKSYQDYIRKVGEKTIIKMIDEKNYDALLFYTDANKFTLKACETGLQYVIDTEDKEAYAMLIQYKDKIKGYDKNTLKQFNL